uniref:Uncharacterized protein n=1 Tax=Anopheles dirus TaxID=7168 RepID=A0A182NXZ2_9DIPT
MRYLKKIHCKKPNTL